VEKELKDYIAKQKVEAEQAESNRMMEELEKITSQATSEVVSMGEEHKVHKEGEKENVHVLLNKLPGWAMTNSVMITQDQNVKKSPDGVRPVGGKWKLRQHQIIDTDQSSVGEPPHSNQDIAEVSVGGESLQNLVTEMENNSYNNPFANDFHGKPASQMQEQHIPNYALEEAQVTKKDLVYYLDDLDVKPEIPVYMEPGADENNQAGDEEENYKDEKFEDYNQEEDKQENLNVAPQMKASPSEPKQQLTKVPSPENYLKPFEPEYSEEPVTKKEGNNRTRSPLVSVDPHNPILKYKHEPNQMIESILDINHIKSQISMVERVVEGIEKEKSVTGKSVKSHLDPHDYKSHTDPTDLSSISHFSSHQLPSDYVFRQDMTGISPERKEPNKDKSKSPKQSTPSSSGVFQIDKKNLVPTTLEEIYNKRATFTGADLQSISMTPMQKDSETERALREEMDRKTPMDTPQGIHGINRLTFQPVLKRDNLHNLVYDDESQDDTNRPTSSLYKLSATKDLPTLDFSGIQDSKNFMKQGGTEEDAEIEKEIEANFDILNESLKKLDLLMAKVNYGFDKNATTKNRLLDKLDNKIDETKKSLNNISFRSQFRGDRTEKSFTTNNNDVSVQKSISDMVIHSSRDLLENYSRMLVDTFQKELMKQAKGGNK
jgi:hypothetical protein